MKDKNLLTWIVVVIALVITALCAGYSLRGAEDKPNYSPTDSIARDSLEKQIANRENAIEYHKENAEKLKAEKESLNKSNYKLSERLKELLKNPTAKCEDKLELSLIYNDSLKLELIKCDSAYIEVDKECENYAIQLESYKDINKLEIKRFNALSYKSDSIILNYKDSITAINKHHKKRMFWTNVKWCVVSAIGIYGTIQLAK